MILQYKKYRGELIQKRAKLNKEDPHDKLDLTQYNSMIDEMNFVLQWLETGRDPNNYRGADKRGIYQSQSFQSMVKKDKLENHSCHKIEPPRTKFRTTSDI
ncbi:hypothetical protein [Planococcus rifietoensis]|uniref:hypothetical protein n=1 Tax=Planococcus rifietoensis TaxID=200991 RepID=UPI0038516C81